MFGRWLFVRIGAAEKALREGRIDDACAAVEREDLREHTRGQRLLDELVKPLMARARLHRQAGRLRAALADLDKLAAFGRATSAVQTLRQQVAEEMQADVRADAEAQAAAGRAADLLRAGRLETMRADLDGVKDPQQREALAQELERRVERSGQLLAQAADALGREDVLGALRLWQEACRRHGRSGETDAFAVRLGESCRRACQQWFADGHVDRLLTAHAQLDPLIDREPTVAEGARLAELCARAATNLSAADYTNLRQTLLRLKGIRADVPWVNDALTALASLSDAQERLTASPLGLCASRAAPPTVGDRPGKTALLAVAPLRGEYPVDPHALRLEKPLLLLVDGAASALLVTGERVRLGRGGSAVAVDVPLPGDLHTHHADIIRRGEDYFLTAYGRVEVNHRVVEHTLLRDGDRLVLGSQTRMVFCRPSAKSDTAVLRLSHRNRLAQDVSEIVLFQDTCLIGPGVSCHVRTREGNGQLVLFARGGALHARQTAGDGWAAAPVQAVAAGQTLECGDVRLTVKPYEMV
jgi:hypothetical protein